MFSMKMHAIDANECYVLDLPQDRIPPIPQSAKYLGEANSQESPSTTAAAAMPDG